MSARRQAPMAYVDTNVIDNLVKRERGLTEADEIKVREHVSSGRLIVLTGHVTIRESLAALVNRPEVARAQLKLLDDIADWGRFLKFSTEILEEDIKHFAFNGEGANSAFEGALQTAKARATIRAVVDGRMGITEFRAAIDEDRDFKRRFREGIHEARTETKAGIEVFRRAGEIPSFEEWFQHGWEDYLRAFVKTFEVSEACEARGLERLFRIPSLRSLVSLGMATIYRTAVERKPLKGSASRDLQHGVCAAAARADIFLTHDTELAILLKRSGSKNPRVMRLREFLDSMKE